jgi:hypothetical protein
MAQSAAQKAAFQKMLASRKGAAPKAPANPMKKAGTTPTLAQVFAPKKKVTKKTAPKKGK